MMCCPKFSSSRASIGQFLSCMLILAGVSEAQTNGTWSLNNNGQWFDTNNWSGGVIANGGGTADFSNLDISGHRTITITGAAATLSSMLIGDASGGSDYRFSNGAGGSLIFDGGGSSSLTVASGRSHRFNDGFVLNDQLEVSVNAGGLSPFGAISGAGGITAVTGLTQLRLATLTYQGPTIINGGSVMWAPAGNESPYSNIIIYDGFYERYYNSNLTTNLGTGPKEIQILGGDSGFSGGNINVTLNGSGSTLVWGSSYFKPTKFKLGGNNRTTINNRLDLNGVTRTINVVASGQNPSGHAQISGVIKDDAATGTGLIKEGLGVLYLAHNNTFTGGVEIKEGVVRVGHANALGTQTDGGLNFTGGGTKLDIRNNISLKSLASTEVYFGTITNGGATATTLTIDLSADSTYRGLVEDGYTGGTTSITKTGPATLTFGDAASYHSGETKINEGTFILDQNWNFAASTITVASGAVFGGDGLLGGDLTFADGAKFAFDPAKTLSVDAYNRFLGLNTDLGNLGLADLVLTNAASVDDGTYVLINGASTIDATDLQNYGSANAGSFEGKTAYFDLVDSDSDVDSSLDLVLVVGSVDPDTSTYTGWKASHGLEGASDDSDSDGDNIALIVEFALGGDPTAADIDILPTMKMTEDLGNAYLELMITRPVGLTGISYLPQTHTAMSGWPSDSTGIINANPTPLDNGDGTESVTYRRAQAISDSTKAFMRLQVQPSP